MNWLLEDQLEIVKIGESEQEGENKEERKEAKDFFQDELKSTRLASSFFAHHGTSYFIWDYFWNHHLEVPTPPPELYI